MTIRAASNRPARRPAREDVRRLGALVGEMLAEQVSPRFLEEVERVRTAASRGGTRPAAGVAGGLLDGLAPTDAEALVRLSARISRSVNIAERGAPHPPPPRVPAGRRRGAAEGLHDVLLRLKAQGVSLHELVAWLPRIDVEPVFTAHPTEAVRRALLEKEQLMVASLVATSTGSARRESGVGPGALPHGADLGLADVGLLAGAPERGRRARARRLLSDRGAVPGDPGAVRNPGNRVRRYLRQAPELPRMLRFGTWVGGDMDGNPERRRRHHHDDLRAQRRAILQRYLEELRQLASLLSQTVEVVSVSPEVLRRVEEYRALLPQAADANRGRATATCPTACSTT
jgi:phosphoenolpyruvate carboxylase